MSLEREWSNLKGHKPPFWISVNLCDTFKIQVQQDKRSLCVTISKREKDEAQPIISYMCLMVYLVMVDLSFS